MQTNLRGECVLKRRRVIVKFCRQTEGQAMIEMALVLPLLLLLVTGIFSFGVFINNNVILTNAVDTGGRLLAVSRGSTTDPCNAVSTAVINAAPTLSSGKMTFSFNFNGVPYPGTSCASASFTTGAAGNLVQGQPATVTVSYPCSLTVYGHNYAPTCNLSAKTTELIQ